MLHKNKRESQIVLCSIYPNKPHTATFPGEKVQIDVKVVPSAYIVGQTKEQAKKMYQRTYPDKSNGRIIHPPQCAAQGDSAYGDYAGTVRRHPNEQQILPRHQDPVSHRYAYQ